MKKSIKNKLLKVVVGVTGATLLCISPVKIHAESMMSQIGKNLVYGLFTHPIQAEKQYQEKISKMAKHKARIIARIHAHHITMGYIAHHTGKIEQMNNNMSHVTQTNPHK